MNIKIRLTLMSFLQFFVWGAWLITVGNYWFGTKQWSGAEFGAIFSTLGISSIIMPAITGIVADKWINAERLYGILHILGGLCVAYLPQVDNPTTFYWVIFAAMMCYMPTISLSNSVAYTILKENDFDVVKVFPPIRVWGTVGFILAMWTTNLTGNKASANMFYISALTAIILGIYSFTLPACKPQNLMDENATLSKKLGLDSFKLFNTYKMALFFVFSMFLGGALQLTNMYGDVFLSEFGNMPQYANSLIVKNSTLIMSISQISETLFILAIPFFLKRFGIKQVMLISMLAWVLRFGLFAYGNPASGLWMIILSCIVYGMAFDFFNISGSLFVETTTDSSIRSSAQGLFMMMTNGFGSFFGGLISGKVIDAYFTINGQRDWHSIWFSFAIYALIIAIAFAFLFKHKHNPKDVESFSH
ncbi:MULTISPECIES: nucleoside permease [Flavobacterium]|uniref:Nucleoside permease n=2 Tax=Flavobacterium TaxID=237 RepID=A0ABW8PQX0_9FLAO|nr:MULTISPECIES: nucleoside permease [Flavobacterium]QYS88681.1 nucleoside permease [Flavobacterium davisii]SPE77672.1 Nucleoside permease NupG [Flavobacterium columnare]